MLAMYLQEPCRLGHARLLKALQMSGHCTGFRKGIRREFPMLLAQFSIAHVRFLYSLRWQFSHMSMLFMHDLKGS